MPEVPVRTTPPGTDAEALVSAFFAAYSASASGPVAFLLENPVRAVRALTAVRRLPSAGVRISASGEGDAVRSALGRTCLERLLMGGTRSVLVVPVSAAEYLNVHARATVRRKVRAAERAGLTWHAVRDADERFELLASADAQERLHERPEYRVAQPDNADLLGLDLWLVATTGDGAPLLLAVLPTDGAWSTLRYFRTLVHDDQSSLARYFLMPALIDALAERGVRYIVDTARPQWLPPGLLHFQRMVGFRLMRLRIDPPQRRGSVAPARSPIAETPTSVVPG